MGLLKDSLGLLAQSLPAVGVLTAITLLWQVLMSLALMPAFVFTGAVSPEGLGGGTAVILLLMVLMRATTSAGFMRWVADGLLGEKPRLPAAMLSAALASSLFLILMWLVSALVVAFGMMLCVIPGVYLAVCISLAPAALIIDGHGPISAVNHSYAIVKGYRWQLLFLAVVLVIIIWCVATAMALVSSQLERAGVAGDMVGMALNAVVNVTAGCLLEGAIVLAYLRITRRPLPDAQPQPAPVSPALA